MANRPAPAAALTDEQLTALTAWSRSRVLPQRQVLRARIVLLAAEGVPNLSIAARLGCSVPTVRLWRRRFSEAGIAGLEEDAPDVVRRVSGRGRTRHGQDWSDPACPAKLNTVEYGAESGRSASVGATAN